MTTPKVFISYSHDTLEHKKWVLELAIRLRNNGIDAIIDQFELKPGDDIPHFMETHLIHADRIIMVCTDRYVEKANNGKGGVGYEKMIVTSSYMERIDENKVIPIIRQNGTSVVPIFLRSKLYIDFSKVDDYESCYDDLVRAIHKAPLFEKPPVGNNPFVPVIKEKLDGDNDLLNSVLRSAAMIQGINQYVDLTRIAKQLDISIPLCKVAGIKLIKSGHLKWYVNGDSFTITEKGLMYAYDNSLL